MGWAKNNLSEDQLEQIARSLFTVKDDKGDWLNGLCPLHDDTNASFGYNVTEDVFHCQADCSKDGDLIDLYCRVNGLDPSAGFVEFKKTFVGDQPLTAGNREKGKEPGKTGQKKKKDKPPVDYVQMAEAYDSFPELPDSWLAKLAEVRGWKKETVLALGLRKQTKYRDKHNGSLKNVSADYARIAIPVRDKDGKLKNIRLYKPNATEAKIISWGAGTGTNRLFPWPEKGVDGIAWICEGEADTICARSLGLEAYTQTAKRKNWPDDQVEPFRDRDVVICYDADQPGANYGSTAANTLAKVTRSVRVLEWPDFMGRDKNGEYPEKHGQDLTDFIVKHKKTRKDLENLLPDAREFKEEDEDTAWQFFGTTMAGRDSFQPRLLAERLRQDVELLNDKKTGLLYRWGGQFYEEYHQDSLKRRAIKYLGNESVKSRYVDAVDQATLLSTISSGREINDNHGLLCLKNGMLDINTFKILPHDKNYLSTVQIQVQFDPERPAKCDRWIRFLGETIQTREVIEQFQEFFGLCLTRETRYNKCLIMLGDGGDGKSIAQDVLRELVGPANCTSVSLSGLEDQFQRVLVYDKLVNMSAEVGGGAIDSEYFKLITGGDEITASYKNKQGFGFKPFCKLMFAVNRMPKITDSTDGLYRRLLPIHFKRQFLDGDPDRDPFLYEKLLVELDGIFAWALAGLHRLRKRGEFDTSVPETQKLLSEYRRQNSPVYTFVQDCCLVGGEEYTTSRADLYQAYRTWSGKNGFGAVHSQNFFTELRMAIKVLKKEIKDTRPRVKGTPTRSFKGIGLIDSEMIQPDPS